MATVENVSTPSKGLYWTGWVIGGLPALFLLVDAVMKFFKPEIVVRETTKLGYSEDVILPLGAVLLVSTILYLVPRTSVLGAILLTGYLGGAVDVHVRQADGWFNTVFPAIFGVLLWGGLCLRNAKIRAAIF